MQAVIMAGGKGTRLQTLTHDEIPKPMMSVCGKPLLQRQIDCLRNNGVDNILIITGHLGNVITSYFEGEKDISFFAEPEPLGTAGALGLVKDRLEKQFFLLFGDVLFDVALDKMAEFHKMHDALLTLFAHPNSHPFDSDLIVTDEHERVLCFDSKNNNRDYWYHNLVNGGIYFLSKSICQYIDIGVKTDLEKDLIAFLCAEKKGVYAYSSSEYVKDLGTPERILQAEEDIKRGIVASRNILRKQRAVFLDRDGTINVYKGLIYNESEFELEENVVEAIKYLNQSSYLTIVITNQPVVARGLCSIDDIDCIHRKMESLIGNEGAYLDAVFYCPHHPDKGYPEENPFYKIPCRCRKPNIGMIEEAAEKFNIDLKQSWFIGDTTIDIQTGKNAGLKTALVLTGEAGKDGKYSVRPNLTENHLLDVVNKIMENGSGGDRD